MSRSETALQALFDGLDAAAREGVSALPAPLRNEDVFVRMQADDTGLHRYLNIWDGETRAESETLGADDVDDVDDDQGGAYDIALRPRIDWIVAGGTRAEREAAFDAGLIAIHDVLRGARVDGDKRFLGGAVDWSGIERIARSGLTTDGLPGIKACEIVALLEFTSARPF